MLDRDAKNVIVENIIISKPEWQRIFFDSEVFSELLTAWISFLESDTEEDRKIKASLLEHANSIFEHLCNTDPEGLKEKKRHEEEYNAKMKRNRMDSLYQKYLQSIKEGG